MKQLRSDASTKGNKMAGARALWRANGMKDEQFGKPIIAIVNSFTQFVPGHTHLHEIGQEVKKEIEKLGCYAAEFNTIAIDDGIAMGHSGMLYSLPSRDLIADSVEYMCNAHKVDAMLCISNCDKITPGMLIAAMRLNIPTVFVSGGPMEAGNLDGEAYDLVDVMVQAADKNISEDKINKIENIACPTCGSCSGMFTANSMNCLSEALGMALVGNGTVLATHKNRKNIFLKAAKLIVKNTFKYYNDDDQTVLPRSIATREAFLNAMSLDIAMGGSTNTVLHLLAIANEAEVDFTMHDIDALSRKIPVLCKVSPNSKYHIQDVNRAGGVMGILAELNRAGCIHKNVYRVDSNSLKESLYEYDIVNAENNKLNSNLEDNPYKIYFSAPCNHRNLKLGNNISYYKELDLDRKNGCIRNMENAYSKEGGLAVLYGNLAEKGSIIKTAGVKTKSLTFKGSAIVFESQEKASEGILSGKVKSGNVIVIRYEGPKGGPGMQEMLYPTSYLKSVKLDKECALITDGRFSGGSSGMSVGHISPEAAAKGNIALIKNGDIIEIDIPKRKINVLLSKEELSLRRTEMNSKGNNAYKPLSRDRIISKALRGYALTVSSADQGGIRLC